MGFTDLNSKFPLFSSHYLHTDGKDIPFKVLGHHISDLGREEVIGLFEVPVDDMDIKPGEALVIDTLYISGPVV